MILMTDLITCPILLIVRAGAHTDYGSLTLLFQKDIGGLEVQASRTEWISAPIIENAILGTNKKKFWHI